MYKSLDKNNTHHLCPPFSANFAPIIAPIIMTKPIGRPYKKITFPNSKNIASAAKFVAKLKAFALPK